MTARQTDATTDPQSLIAALQQRLDAALSEKTTLAAALVRRDSEYGKRVEHQAAIIEVLKAMSASPGNPHPVFDLIVMRARDLCDAYGATVYKFDGTLIHWGAATGVSDDPTVRAAIKSKFPMLPTREWAAGRAILDRQIIRIDDIQSEPGLNATIRGGTAKSGLVIPLMRCDTVFGALALGSRERGGFSDSQAELLKTFAEQAVIAITSAETYRKLNQRTADLHESLEYQTAISDVLKVISRSTFDLQPVLDTVVAAAARLCDAEQAVVGRREGDKWWLSANFGFPPEYEAYYKERGFFSYAPDTPSVGARVAREGRIVHIDDVAAVPGYPAASISLGKHRTMLGVPLIRDGEVIGSILLARQRVEPFTQRQIELVSTFADQAVIAIENTRLLTEQREALERQTGTAEVLQVINASPGNLAPVFDTILEKAILLCEASFGGLATYDGECFQVVATRGMPTGLAEALRGRGPLRPSPGMAYDQIARGADIVHIPDITARQIRFPEGFASSLNVDQDGARTMLFVALRGDNALFGALFIYRKEVRLFSDRQVALLQNFAAHAVIAMDNARLIAEQREALEQQTAMAEVLQVINASPGDLERVFATILEKAILLCKSSVGGLSTYDGEYFHHGATRGMPTGLAEALRKRGPIRPSQSVAYDQIVRGADIVHIPDITARGVSFPSSPNIDQDGARTTLFVALRGDDALLGAFVIYRREVRLFSDKQIALLQNFAAQAVIAMENARLITEQREALEQQTATAEVLQVINASPGNLAPVFDAMLEKALRLCDAAFGNLWTYDGEVGRLAAIRGASPEYRAELMRAGPQKAEPGNSLKRLVDGEPLVHIADITAEDAHRSGAAVRRMLADRASARTVLWVPLRKDGALLGFFTIYRTEVRRFTDKQIALLKNFAAQAVIAMENARLITEQREALEQQTATAEVLQVINASPGNLAPVFDAMLEKAMRLCGAAFGMLRGFDGKLSHNLATRGVPAPLAQYMAENVFAPMGALAQALEDGRPRQILDMKDTEGYKAGATAQRAIADLGGARSIAVVPLVKDQTSVGHFTFYRQDVRAFTDKQIALLENFAAQAVIAMESARLLTEQREALEQQTATAEVLQVINASPGNLAPVYDAMLEKAMHLCGAAFGSLTAWDGNYASVLAMRGFPPALAQYMAARGPRVAVPPVIAQLAETLRPQQLADVMAGEGYRSGHPVSRAVGDLGGARTILHVPLRKDAAMQGYISVYRQEVRAFTDKQIALLENFAAQAVIAMENARLLTETREALEQQTATAEVLQVINASPGNLTPVFDTILAKAHRLCGATVGSLTLYKDGSFHAVATHGYPEQVASLMLHPSTPNAYTRELIRGERFHQIEDIRAIEISPHYLILRTLVEHTDVRTVLFVPLRKDGALLGFISVNRPEVRPFSENEIALLENFAAQAVIAMENARLMTEQREALEQQTATAEVLQVINASPGNLAPVFDAMLEKAIRLCDATYGHFRTYDGEGFPLAAVCGDPSLVELHRQRMRYFVPGPHNPISRFRRGERLIHISDAAASEAYSDDPGWRELVDTGACRSVLAVALRKDTALLGYISVYRQEVRAFSDKQIALLENFAAQAVVAMENARLLDEIRQRQEELRVTFENMGDGVAMFDETPRLVAWNRKFQDILDLPDGALAERPTFAEYIRYLTERGEFGPGADPEEQIRRLTENANQYRAFERVRPDGRVIEIRHNPVPGGGFVLIYADITERKRNEAEISAARDAAEKASRTIEAAFRELKAAQANLIQAEKMASLGQLTAGIAHEIKNPLNFVNNFAALSVDLLSELKETAAPGFAALTDNQRAEIDDVSDMLTSNLEKITEHGKRADGIVKAMLEHSRGSSGERRMVDLNAVIDEALNLAYHGARAQDQSFDVTLERDFGDGIAPIEVNPQDMTRVFLNIFSNGFYAATKRARNVGDSGLEPTLKVTTRDAGDVVEIRVRDNGAGIPPDIRDKLFQPFFTTKPTGEGTGLGLSITYDIVTKAHGGSIAVDSEVGEYSEFTIRLPRSTQLAHGFPLSRE